MSIPATPPPSGPTRPWSLPPAPLRSLPEGPTLQAVRMGRQPLVQLAWTWPAARLLEAPAPRGSLRLLTSLLRHGAGDLDSAALADRLDQMGARLRVSASTDSLTVSMAALSEQLDEALDLLDAVALRPTFPEAHLRREQKKALDLLRHERADPDHQANQWLCALVYGAHPYGQVSATAAGLAAVERDHLVDLHARITAPARGHLLLVGDLDPEALLDRLARRYADQRGGEPRLNLPGPASPRPRRVVGIARPASEQTSIARGQLLFPRLHPDLLPLRLANEALGGGSGGRLFTVLREEKGLTYGVSSELDAGLIGGDLTIAFSAATARTAEAVAALDQELLRFRDAPPGAEELDRARRKMVGSFVHSTVGAGAVAGLLARAHLLGLPLESLANRPAILQAITDGEAQAAAARWLRPGSQSLVLVGAAAALDEALADEDAVLRVDLDDPDLDAHRDVVAAG